jgi:hypothetical protein
MRRVLAIALLAAGCHVTASDGVLGGDANGDVDPDAARHLGDAPAGCANGRVVYLNFEGVTLTKAAASDATQKHASWMNATPAVIPAWNAASADRASDIATIVSGVQAQLASGFPGPIAVTTVEPTVGPYVMVVYGGTSAQSHSNFGSAVNELDCDDSEKSDVAWIRDSADPVNTISVINTTIGAIGFGLGLTATNDPRDCMCSWANGCTKDQTQLCILHDGIARDPSQAAGGTATQTCAGAGITEDEHAVFLAAFCN